MRMEVGSRKALIMIIILIIIMIIRARAARSLNTSYVPGAW